MSDSEDENWIVTYPKNVGLLLNPGGGHNVVLIQMTTKTHLPFPYRAGKGLYYIVNNDLLVSFNGTR